MMLFFMHLMTVGIPFMDKVLQGPLFVTHLEDNVAFSYLPTKCCCLFTYFSWVPAVIWTVWNNPQLEALFWTWDSFFFQIPRPSVCLTLKISKYPEPEVLWLWPFSKIQNPWWFFDSGNFQISRTDGSLILKVLKYPKPMVVWFWRFSNGHWKLTGITKKIKYPPPHWLPFVT